MGSLLLVLLLPLVALPCQYSVEECLAPIYIHLQGDGLALCRGGGLRCRTEARSTRPRALRSSMGRREKRRSRSHD